MRKLIFAMVCGVLLLPDYAYTLGMGEIEVNSALNQQLDARIELLSAAPEDAESLIIKLASRDEFNRAGLDRPFTLNDLKFAPYTENGQVYIKVSTAKPVREPFLNFLIEIDWPKGHLLREFTILLDPPVYMGQPDPAQLEDRPAVSGAASEAQTPAGSSAQEGGFRPAAVPVAVPAPASAQPQTAAPVTTQQQTRYAPASYTSTEPGGRYRVQTGDTAWSLANRMRPDESVSVEQMMLAMLRTNPEVFINENVNGLKRGYILRIPDRNAINATSQAEALQLIRQQNALWREYQQALAGARPTTAMGAEGDTGAAGSSGMSRRSDARLEIVSAGSGTAAAGSSKDPAKMTATELREQLALAREAIETERVEKEALQGQIGSLEQRLDRMKGLISIEDAAMADVQDLGKPADETAMPAEEAMPVDEDITGVGSEEAALDALDALTGEAAPEGVEEQAEEADGEAVFVEEQAEQEVVELASPVEPQLDRARPAPMPREETGLVASLLNNPLVAGGLAVVVLIMLGVVYILIKRRRDAAAQEVEAMLAADSGLDLESELEDVADMIDDEAIDDLVLDEEVEASMAEVEAEAEEEFDADATMILPSAEDTIMTEADSQEEEAEEERDDVIAEADVYLAYGIYQQAEDLLKTALAENPDKDAYRVKLAETYFAGKNASELSALGAEMKQRQGGEETAAWRKVAAMGKELCPDDEIFQQAGMVPDLDIDDLMPKTPEPMDIDLGDETDLDMPELDTDFAEEAEKTEPEMPVFDETAVMSAEDMPEVEAVEAATDELGDLEFDLSETEAVTEPVAEKPDEPEAEEEFSLDIEASELGIEDESLLKESEPEPEAEDMDMEADVSELDFDIGEADAEAAPAEVAEDLSTVEDVSLDELGAELDELAEETGSETAPVDEPDTTGEDEMDLSDLSDVDEISTKLDLARAYLDMGDHEGARDILDEVMLDGNDQQKQEAEELIKDLG